MRQNIKNDKNFYSPTKRKILTFLEAGIALSLTRSPKKCLNILKQIPRELENIDKQYLYRIIREFYNERLVDWKEKDDGIITIILSESGKKRVLKYNIDKLQVKKPNKWDGKWRAVFFDVPEKKRKIRDAFRRKLRDLGFLEMQKSVFVYPHNCCDEINFIVEFFEARRFVRFAEMTNLTNEAQLKLHFGLK